MTPSDRREILDRLNLSNARTTILLDSIVMKRAAEKLETLGDSFSAKMLREHAAIALEQTFTEPTITINPNASDPLLRRPANEEESADLP